MWIDSSEHCMSLHVEVSGSGAPLVLLHGWGMHGGIWQELAALLAQDCAVHNVDLPGHGASAALEGYALDHIVDRLDAQFAMPVSVMGWSLGGLIAQRWAARMPGKVRRLVLVASTPCFTERADWAHGMPQETLALFAAGLQGDLATTLRRFIALQVRGSEHERALLQQLRERLFSRGEPQMMALRGGLDILRDIDLREALPRIEQDTLIVTGERDKLTPPAASHHMAQVLPHARLVEIKGAAHAPFLSHPHEFAGQLRGFLNG